VCQIHAADEDLQGEGLLAGGALEVFDKDLCDLSDLARQLSVCEMQASGMTCTVSIVHSSER
jgi:hypothetical protein